MGLLTNKMVTNVLLLAKLNYKITKGRNSSDTFGRYSWKHGLRTPRESFFQKSWTDIGQTFWAETFWGIWGIFGRTISTHFGTVISLSSFSLFNLLLIITALVTQWMIDHLAHAQVLEKGESEHSPHLPSVSHWRWDMSQINLFLHLITVRAPS